MSQKNIKSCRSLLLVLLIGISLIACKKEEPAKFSGDSFVYFLNDISNTDGLDPSSIINGYTPEQTLSFLVYLFQIDTVKTNQYYVFKQFPLNIQSDGKISDKRRLVTIEVEGNGKQYIVLPNPDSIYIPANKREYKLNLKIVRPPLSDTSVKTATLILKDNDSFKPEKQVWHKVTYKFGNILTEPLAWTTIESKFGKFSRAKMTALQEAVNNSDKSFWANDPNVALLNTTLQSSGRRNIEFNPFSFSELYYYLDMATYGFYIPWGSASIMNAYWTVSDKMISLTKQLIVERRAQNRPIVDESGTEISFP